MSCYEYKLMICNEIRVYSRLNLVVQHRVVASGGAGGNPQRWTPAPYTNLQNFLRF